MGLQSLNAGEQHNQQQQASQLRLQLSARSSLPGRRLDQDSRSRLQVHMLSRRTAQHWPMRCQLLAHQLQCQLQAQQSSKAPRAARTLTDVRAVSPALTCQEGLSPKQGAEGFANCSYTARLSRFRPVCEVSVRHRTRPSAVMGILAREPTRNNAGGQVMLDTRHLKMEMAAAGPSKKVPWPIQGKANCLPGSFPT